MIRDNTFRERLLLQRSEGDVLIIVTTGCTTFPYKNFLQNTLGRRERAYAFHDHCCGLRYRPAAVSPRRRIELLSPAGKELHLNRDGRPPTSSVGAESEMRRCEVHLRQ
jgi:hypothetical protein